MRLIDADALKESISASNEAGVPATIICDVLDEAPTITDVVKGYRKETYDKDGSCSVEASGSEAIHIIKLLTAEAQNRLVELPCNIGDTIYHIPRNAQGWMLTLTVVAIHISDEKSIREKLHKSHVIAVDSTSKLNARLNFEDFGKIVFRNRDEAEKALKEREREEKA